LASSTSSSSEQFLLRLKGRYSFASVIEAPLCGMAGVSGINSVALASRHP
jgi:hypothetical protein